MPRKGQKISKPRIETRGGARPGAGRKHSMPNYMLSEHQYRKSMREIHKRARDEGKSHIDVILDEVYNGETAKDRLAACRMINEITLPKTIKAKNAGTPVQRSTMGLPPQLPDGAKLDIHKGGRSNSIINKLPSK